MSLGNKVCGIKSPLFARKQYEANKKGVMCLNLLRELVFMDLTACKPNEYYVKQ